MLDVICGIPQTGHRRKRYMEGQGMGKKRIIMEYILPEERTPEEQLAFLRRERDFMATITDMFGEGQVNLPRMFGDDTRPVPQKERDRLLPILIGAQSKGNKIVDELDAAINELEGTVGEADVPQVGPNAYQGPYREIKKGDEGYEFAHAMMNDASFYGPFKDEFGARRHCVREYGFDRGAWDSQTQVFKVIDSNRFLEAVKAWDGRSPFYEAGEAEREARRRRLETQELAARGKSDGPPPVRPRQAEIARREAEAASARREAMRKAKRKGKGS